MPHDLPAETYDALAKEGLDLTDRQIAYVYEYVQNGGAGGQAAEAAGYAASGADAMSSRNLRNPNIIRAIHVVSVMHLAAGIPGALKTIRNLSTDAKSEYVRGMMAKDVLDRVGLTAPKRVEVNGSVSVSIDLS